MSLAIAALVGVGVTVAAMLAMNRGDRWFVNLKAQDEPLLVGVGTALIVWRPDELATILIGGAAIAIGLASRYTSLMNIG